MAQIINPLDRRRQAIKNKYGVSQGIGDAATTAGLATTGMSIGAGLATGAAAGSAAGPIGAGIGAALGLTKAYLDKKSGDKKTEQANQAQQEEAAKGQLAPQQESAVLRRQEQLAAQPEPPTDNGQILSDGLLALQNAPPEVQEEYKGQLAQAYLFNLQKKRMGA